MKPVPLNVVRYFKGEETRLISKHLHSDAAHQVASRFIGNLQGKAKEATSITTSQELVKTQSGDLHPEDTLTRYTLTGATGSLNEGVTVTLEAQKDPNWDYPLYSE